MSQPAHMRSMPKQERGELRMQRLLDTAEQTFAELGYKATTTNEIAARAHTSIGTLYRFFPNKEAIVQQLIERYGQELHEMHEKMFQPEIVTMPLAEMVDHLIDPIIALKSVHPGLVSLFIGPQAALQIPDELGMFQNEWIHNTETLWLKRFPYITQENCHLHAVVFLQIMQALLTLAFSFPSQEQIIRELKANLFRYLEPLEIQAAQRRAVNE